MFDAAADQATLIAKLAKLDPMQIGLHADALSLEKRGDYIRDLTKLVADHIESLMADAAASISAGRIDEEDARSIADTGSDLAGQLIRAAEMQREAA